jgi:hypothetical protein
MKTKEKPIGIAMAAGRLAEIDFDMLEETLDFYENTRYAFLKEIEPAE